MIVFAVVMRSSLGLRRVSAGRPPAASSWPLAAALTTGRRIRVPSVRRSRSVATIREDCRAWPDRAAWNIPPRRRQDAKRVGGRRGPSRARPSCAAARRPANAGRGAALVRAVLAEAGLDDLHQRGAAADHGAVHQRGGARRHRAGHRGDRRRGPALTVTVTDFAARTDRDGAGECLAPTAGLRPSGLVGTRAWAAAGRPLRRPVGHDPRRRPQGCVVPARPIRGGVRPCCGRPTAARTGAALGSAPAVPRPAAGLTPTRRDGRARWPDRARPYADDPLRSTSPPTPARPRWPSWSARPACRSGSTAATAPAPRPLARYGRPPRPTTNWPGAAARSTGRYNGELELDAAPSAYAQPLAGAGRRAPRRCYVENDRLRRADLRRQSWLTFLAEASELLAQSLDVQPDDGSSRSSWCRASGSGARCTRPTSGARLDRPRPATPTSRCCRGCTRCSRRRGPESVRRGCARRRGPSRRSRSGRRWRASRCRWWPAGSGSARSRSAGTSDTGTTPDEIAVIEDVARRAAPRGSRTPGSTRSAARSRTPCNSRCCRRCCRWSRASGSPPNTCRPATPPRSAATSTTWCRCPDDRWLVVVGDVSGKGVPAAAVTGLVRDVIRVLVRDGRPLPEALRAAQRDAGRAGRRPLLHAGARPRSARPAPATATSWSRCTWPATTGRSLVRADGRATFVGTGGTAARPARRGRDAGRRADPAPRRRAGVLHRRCHRAAARAATCSARSGCATPRHLLAGYSADVVSRRRLKTTVLGFSAEAPRDDIAILRAATTTCPVGLVHGTDPVVGGSGRIRRPDERVSGDRLWWWHGRRAGVCLGSPPRR